MTDGTHRSKKGALGAWIPLLLACLPLGALIWAVLET